jgi:DNA-binding LytR/AlgR family response regulator
MFNSLNKKYPFNEDLKFNLLSIFGVSLGVFLFLLFFQPLDPATTDFNKKLLIIAGFGGITLLLLLFLRVFVPSFLTKLFTAQEWTLKKEILLHFIFVVLNTVAFTFFAAYVGRIEITFSLTVKIVLISLIPVLFLVIIYEYQFLRARIKNLLNQNNKEEFPVEDNSEKASLVEFESENQAEYFHLFPEQIILIQAASNYIEIIYKQNEKVSRRLIRSTMKKAEKLLSEYPFLLRCHRSCIVNTNTIQKIQKSAEGLKLELYDYPRQVNVSRQYVLSVKNALENPD